MTTARRISILIFLCIVASVVVAVVTAVRITAPSIRPDEWGYLLNGQVLLGREEVRLPFSSMYPAGFGVVTGAWALVGGSLQMAYRLTLFTNIAMMAVLGYLVFRFSVGTLKASRTVGLVAAALVMASPGTLAGSMFAVPETLGKVVFMLLVVLLGSMVSHPRVTMMILFGAVSGLAPMLSSRFVAISVSAVVVLVVLTWNRIIERGIALLGVGSIATGYVVTRLMNSIVRDVLYPGRRSGETRILNRAMRVDLWPEVTREIAGQLWYVSAATACLGLVGLAVMIRSGFGNERAFTRGVQRSPEQYSHVFILLTFGFVIVLGALQLALGKRPDHYIYGRYVEMCIPAFFAIACAALERTRMLALRLWFWSIAFFAFLTAMYVILTGSDVVWRAISTNGPMRTANVLAIDALSQVVKRPGLLTMTPVLCGVSIAVMWSYKRRQELALVGLAGLLLVSSGWTASSTLINRSLPDKGVGVALRNTDHSETSRVAYDGVKSQDRNYFTLRYAAHPVLIVWVDTRTELRIPESFSCLYGYDDREPTGGEWEIIGREEAIERVLWRRLGSPSC